MRQCFDDLIRIMTNSLSSIDESVFQNLLDDCVQTLKKGNKIVLSGLGKNVPVCEKFVGTMTSLGLNSSFMHTNTAVHGDIGMVHSGDLVVILTKSGATVESVYLYDLLKERECTIWLLTFEDNSVLGRKISKSLVIDLEHEGDRWNILPNNSTTLNLIVLQMLAMQICEELDISLNQFKRNHPGGHIGQVLSNG